MAGDGDANSNADGDADGEDIRGEDVDGGESAARSNDGQRFDRLPATAADRVVEGRATREAVVGYFDERFAIPPETFASHSFWEKGAGKIWVYAGEASNPVEREALGMTCLRTRQEHWKPTTDAVQRFGRAAARNVIELEREAATRFVDGEDQELAWDGDWGYLIAARDVSGNLEPLGVGLYVYGELRSTVPKGRQRSL